MGDDHTRKYNDWHIEKPEPSHTVNNYNSNPVPPADEEDKQDSDVSESNPFAHPAEVSQEVDGPSEDDSATVAPTAPARFTQAASHNSHDDHQPGQSADTDPETGLPIPDYLKPYTQDSDNSHN
jgi:hypothetical protein